MTTQEDWGLKTHLQKSHSNGSNKSHGQFQQKPCDVQNLKNGLKFFFIIGHQRKSPFCTFSCINPGLGRPWDMLRKNFLIAIFIMLQKNAFGQKKFQILCTGSKVPFWLFFNFAKVALLNPCMKFEIFFDQKYSFEAL